jgi:hypothetical protein
MVWSHSPTSNISETAPYVVRYRVLTNDATGTGSGDVFMSPTMSTAIYSNRPRPSTDLDLPPAKRTAERIDPEIHARHFDHRPFRHPRAYSDAPRRPGYRAVRERR